MTGFQVNRHSRWIALASLLLAAPIAAADEPLAPIPTRFATDDVTEQPSFQRHVLPLMGRLGCNGRACHGSFQGRGGFRLSLFGFDFQSDHEALTVAPSTAEQKPRVDKENVAASLILNKPTSDDAHEGGQRFEKGGWEHRVFARWIAAGATNDDAEESRLVRLEVTPMEVTFHENTDTAQLRAIAHWSNGASEDVTPLCRFRTNDDSVATINESGVVKSTGAGDTHVVVFYDNGVVPVTVLRPVDRRLVENYPAVATPTKIDELVVDKLRKLGVAPSELCTDAEFLRRASLDITGTLPAPAEVTAFLADTATNKREVKVDELLARSTYAAWWATRFSDLTGNSSQNFDNNSFKNEESRHWYNWMYQRLANNAPYDELVAGLLLAAGRKPGQSFEDYCQEMGKYYRKSDPANYAERDSMPLFWARRTVRKPEEKAMSVAHAFLGVRLQCAECHKHPFDQWTQNDFKQFTSLFTPVQYGTRREDQDASKAMMAAVGVTNMKGNDAKKELPKLVAEGKVVPWPEVYVSFKRGQAAGKGQGQNKGKGKQPPAPKTLTAALLNGKQLTFQEGEDPRMAIMNWLRDPENPYFARSIVNRVWANYFAVGIIEPPDDMNLANPPSNRPLLDWLAAEFAAHKYDLKWLHRTIVLSDAYQRSWRANESNRFDTKNFSHAATRQMPAEVVYDAIRQATASDDALVQSINMLDNRAIGPLGGTQGGGPKGGGNYALNTFGKPQRATNCDCERSMEPSLLQTLYLRNDNEMLGMIDRGDGWVNQIAKQHKLAMPPRQTGDPTAMKKGGKNDQRQLEQQVKQLRQQLKQERKSDSPNAERVAKFEQRLANLEQRLAAVAQAIPGPPEPPAEVVAADEQAAAQTGDLKLQQPVVSPTVEEHAPQWVRSLYLRTLSREPNDQELQRAVQYLHESANPGAGLRDLAWAVLNTKEFILNH